MNEHMDREEDFNEDDVSRTLSGLEINEVRDGQYSHGLHSGDIEGDDINQAGLHDEVSEFGDLGGKSKSEDEFSGLETIIDINEQNETENSISKDAKHFLTELEKEDVDLDAILDEVVKAEMSKENRKLILDIIASKY